MNSNYMIREPLESRLKGIENLKDDVYIAFSHERYNPENRKFDLRGINGTLRDINSYLDNRFDFSKNTCRSISATFGLPMMKRAIYGAMSLGKLPKEYLSKFNDWEKTYLLFGRWDIKVPDFSKSLENFSLEHLSKGVSLIKRRKKIPENMHRNGGDERIPFSKEIKKLYLNRIEGEDVLFKKKSVAKQLYLF